MAKRQKLSQPQVAQETDESDAASGESLQTSSSSPSTASSAPSSSGTSSSSESDSDDNVGAQEMDEDNDNLSEELDEASLPGANDEQLEDTDSEDEVEDAVGRPPFDAVKARSKLHQGVKAIRAAAKTAKAFELQRLVKKVKGSSKRGKVKEIATEELEAEIEALKAVDTYDLAKRALVAKMVKNKLLPRPSTAKDDIEQEFPFSALVDAEPLLKEVKQQQRETKADDKVMVKVLAMLVSSKKLADEVTHKVEDLKVLAGLSEAKTSAKKALQEDTETKLGKGADKGKGRALEADENAREWSGSEEGDEETSDDDDDEAEAQDEEELARLGKEKIAALGDLSQWDGMLGSDSEDDDDDDDVTQGNKGKASSSSKRKRQRSDSLSQSEYGSDEEAASEGELITDDDDENEDDDDAGSDSDADDDDSDSDSDAPPRKKAKGRKAKATSSTFLPSLSTGFIGGRSDDDWSDAEADLADRDLSELKSGKKKDEKKNRWGQRRRKALWEKKYGRNANHVKLREKESKKKQQSAFSAATTSGDGSSRPVYGEGQQGHGWGVAGGGGGRGGRQALPSQSKSAPQLESGIDSRRSRGGAGVKQRGAPMGGPPSSRPAAPSSAQRPPLPPPPPFRNAAPIQANKAAPMPAEMHPSWIAKQKQKELAANTKPAGKKITFD